MTRERAVREEIAGIGDIDKYVSVARLHGMMGMGDGWAAVVHWGHKMLRMDSRQFREDAEEDAADMRRFLHSFADRVLAVLGERGEPVAWRVDFIHDDGPCFAYMIRREEVEWQRRVRFAEQQVAAGEARIVPLYAPTASAPEEPARAEETTT